jgi:PTS system N-acetylgalactosamine-specific IIA component
MDPAAPRAIVIGHGEFAAGMRSAVQKITGRGSVLIALSAEECSSCSLAQLVDLLRARLRESGVSVIFTDLQAGSATMAARKLLRDQPDTVLVVGANLAVLLDFVLNNEATPVDAARHAAERGRLAIQVQEGGA